MIYGWIGNEYGAVLKVKYWIVSVTAKLRYYCGYDFYCIALNIYVDGAYICFGLPLVLSLEDFRSTMTFSRVAADHGFEYSAEALAKREQNIQIK